MTGDPPPQGPAPEVYEASTGTWRPTANAIGPVRRFDAAVLMNCDARVGRVLVAGGATGSAAYEADAWDGVPTVDSVTGSDGSRNGTLIGPSEGGTLITVTGRWLRGTSVELRVGGVDITQVSVNSAGTVVTGVTPPGAVGSPLPIQLLLDGTPADMCGSHLFTYVPRVPPPTVGALRPGCGALGTQPQVYIPGDYLGAHVQVQFGSGPAVAASVGPGIAPWTGIVSVTSPSYSVPTTVPVTLTARGITLAAGTFTEPCTAGVPPTLSGITPACGPAGTAVTLTGQNLPSPVTASFGGSAATGTPDLLRQNVTVAAPPHVVGPVSVSLPGPPPSNTVVFDYEAACDPSSRASLARLRQQSFGASSGGDHQGGPYLPAPPGGPPPAPAQAPVPVSAQVPGTVPGQVSGMVVMPQLAPNPGMAGVPQLRPQTERAATETSHAMVRPGDTESMAVVLCAWAVAGGGLLCGMLAAGRRYERRVCRPAPRWAR